MRLVIGPWHRLLCWSTGLVVIIVSRDPVSMGVVYGAGLLLNLLNRSLLPHLKVLLYAGLPLGLMLWFAYGVLKVDVSEIDPVFVWIRLMAVVSLFQFLLDIPGRYFFYTLKTWRVGIETILILVGLRTMWRDIQQRVDRVLASRFSRGEMLNRRFVSRAKQLPYIVRPVIVSAISTGIQRSRYWRNTNLIGNIQRVQTKGVQWDRLRGWSCVVLLAMTVLVVAYARNMDL